MNDNVSDRKAIITGGTGHLGREVVGAFLHEGYHVHVPWHSRNGWDELTESLDAAATPRLHGMQTDLTDEGKVRDFTSDVANQPGQLTTLLNLVGGFAFGSKVWETELGTWQKMLALNLTSVFLCCKHTIPHIQKASSGTIVNVSSKAALDVQPGSAAYAVAKGGVVTLTRALREELKGTSISINTIMPGIIDTPVTRDLMPDGDPSTWVRPGDIADALVAACSDQCQAVSGSVLRMFGSM